MTASTVGSSGPYDPLEAIRRADLTPARPRELKLMVRDWRSGRATKKLSEAIFDGYVVLFGVVLVGAMIVNVVLQAQRVVASCATGPCLSGRTVLPWAAYALAAAGALAAARLFGPVLASAAEGFWMLDAPIRRSSMLRARMAGIIAGAGVICFVLGGLVSALTGSTWTSILIWAAATGVAGAGAVAFAAAQQGAERRLLTKLATWLFTALGVAALLAVIAVAAGWVTLALPTGFNPELGVALLGLALVVLVIGAVIASARLGRIRRSTLTSGGALVSGISGAFFALDLGLVRDIVVERRALEIGQVRSKPGRSVGLQTLVWRELQRLGRAPQVLIAVAVVLVVPYAADALGLGQVAPVFSALALFGSLIPLMGGLRVFTRTPGLARCLPFTTGQIKRAVVTVPAIVAAVWALLATPAFAGFGQGSTRRDVVAAFLYAVAVGAAGFLGAVRWTTAKGPDFSKPAISTNAGAVPPGLMTNIFRGFDMCLLITAPLLLNLSPVISLVLAGIVALFLLAFDFEAMRIQSEQQRKQMEAERAKRNAARK
ncbi:hypothetical protein FHX74_000366 [Friedmanniella endophytica]|uniref:ABC-2 type transport system permease protein n=1 Tax=Microlunatus kandeliicorticis TaxID=1759536 RepID=A0A7W3IPD0_9ACTN|nr:DUF6297 family protein [Microlunatus kandeliicorticis]MBA8792772.1 hypothetical protein [Microlunatus kandeliicorticis]